MGHSGDGDRRNLRAPGVLYALAEQDIKRLLAWSTVKTSALFCWRSVWRWSVCHCTPAAHRGWTARRTVSSAQPCVFKGLLFLGAGAIISRLHTHTWKKWGHWRNVCRGQPQHACWLPRDICYSSAEWFYQRMVPWQSLFSLSRVEAVALQLAGLLLW